MHIWMCRTAPTLSNQQDCDFFPTLPPPHTVPLGMIWPSVWGYFLSSIHVHLHLKIVSSSLLALFWFDGLWFYWASSDGLSRRDGGFVRIWAITSRLMVCCGRGVEGGFPPLIEPSRLVYLWRLELLLLLWEELVSGLQHFSSLLCL